MVCPRLAPLLILLGLAAPAAAQVDAPALFASSCAKCHGLDGSGTGPAVLDRPARNFKEGGFSFGNTPEVIARTIAHGIPGSPMPAFEGALTDEQLRALGEYVVTLGPPVKEVSEAETLLHVTDRPLVVRGILPPIEEGGPRIARGLLIGTPDGLTFEYAADDVRLLAVRMGDFVKRTDWGDRGGSPLEPLGQVVWRDSDTTGLWSLAGSTAAALQATAAEGKVLSGRLLSTTTSPGAALCYALVPAGETGPAFALVEERPGVALLGKHAGFSRSVCVTRLRGERKEGSSAIELRLGGWIEILAPEQIVDHRGPCVEQWWMRTVAPNVGELLHVRQPALTRVPFELASDPMGLRGRISLDRLPAHRAGDAGGDDQDHVNFELESFVVSPWSPADIAEIRKQVAP